VVSAVPAEELAAGKWKAQNARSHAARRGVR
jgi:hypothetical protein